MKKNSLKLVSRRKARAGIASLVCAAVLTVAGCAEESKVLIVGSKNFTESEVLAEMMALMAEQEGIVVQRAIPYGDSATTFEGLKQGKIDVYPEYNGTGLVYLGQPAMHDGDAALSRVRELYKPLGIDWRGRFGFSNDYVIVMRPELAQAENISQISDLDQLSRIAIATDVTFTQRPLDGLGPLMRRYGLSPGRTLAFDLDDDGKRKIVRALLDEEVQVAELFRTDPHIAAFDLTALEDDLRFFPVYEPAPIVRDQALADFPTLSAALARLENKVSADEMSRLNAEVDLNGRSVAAVALDFLVGKGLLDATSASGAGTTTKPLRVALGGLDSLSGPAGKAVRAARSVFSKRPIEIVRAPNPLDLVVRGDARLAVAGAESFYSLSKDRAVQSTAAEALGLVGHRVAHVVTRASGPNSLAEVKKLGVGEADSASDRTARMLLAGLGISGVTLIAGPSDDLKSQFEAMSKGLVDALLVMAPVGDTVVQDLMKGGKYTLLSIDEWSKGTAPLRFSFLRAVKIPGDTYPGQPLATETLSTQIVLAGPPGEREAFGAQGPGTTGTAATQPIPADSVLKLNEALGTAEAVDPAIPAAAALRPALKEGPQPLVADATTSIVNLLVAVFLVWLVYLLFARKPRRRPSEIPEP